MRHLALALLATALAVEESLHNVADKLTDVRTAGEALVDQLPGGGGGGEQQQGEPVLPPVLPPLRAGDISDEYAQRFPAGVPCTIPAGLKYDPWKEIEVDGVYQLGGWVPLDAPFTAPVA